MNIDTNAFLQSLPIMGVGLLGIFIVTIVLILGIYILKACTAKSANSDSAEKEKKAEEKIEEIDNPNKESAMDLLKEKEKKDFLETEENNYISHDL